MHSSSRLVTQLLSIAVLELTSACGGKEPTSTQPVTSLVCAKRVALQRGQSAHLTQGELSCLQFEAAAGAAYVLGYLDPFTVQSQYDYAPNATEQFTISGSALSSASTRQPSAATARALQIDMRGPVRQTRDLPMTPVREGTPSLSTTTPYAVGDKLTYDFGGETGSKQVQVMAIYESYFVVAMPVEQAAQFRDEIDAKMREATRIFVNTVEPLHAHVFGATRPATPNTDGQFLIMAEYGNGAAGRAYGQHIQLKVGGEFAGGLECAMLLAHEMTHIRQQQYTVSFSGVQQPVGPQWAVEGGAVFVEGEIARRLAGVGFTDNWDWSNALGSGTERQALYAQYAVKFGLGGFATGYGAAAVALRDFVQRLVDSRMPLDDAIRLVLIGALHGWDGCLATRRGCVNNGLTSRMSAQLGTSWNAVDGLLTAVIALAADDLSESSTFQNRSFLKTGSLVMGSEGRPVSMPTLGTLAAGRDMKAISLPSGAFGAVRIDDNTGGAYRVESSKSLEWLLYRMR